MPVSIGPIIMWCEHCRQNVTGMVSQTQDSVCCSRCGCALPGGMPECGTSLRDVNHLAERGATLATAHQCAAPLPCPATNDEERTPVAHAPGSPKRPPALSNWDIDEDLRHIERLLRRDPARIEVPALHLESLPAHHDTAATPLTTVTTSWLTSLRLGLSWLLLCAGLAATVCGLILLVWYALADRAELLIPGLVCAAAGQFGLLGGFLIQPAAVKAAQPLPPTEAAHPAAQWLEVHRRIDEILRADLPGER